MSMARPISSAPHNFCMGKFCFLRLRPSRFCPLQQGVCTPFLNDLTSFRDVYVLSLSHQGSSRVFGKLKRPQKFLSVSSVCESSASRFMNSRVCHQDQYGWGSAGDAGAEHLQE